MIKVGLTGGIGSGKTYVSNIFEKLGAPVFNADTESKKLTQLPEIQKKITEAFGDEVYNENNILQRAVLAQIVFNEPLKLKTLNAILHPEVEKSFIKFCQRKHNCNYIIKEAAILFESGSYKNVDKTITVVAPLETRISRILKRDSHASKESIQKIMDQQMDDHEKIKLSGFVIYNDDSTPLLPQILEIDKLLKNGVL